MGIVPKRRISSEMIKDLRSCLEKLQLKPPYIFVGHSFGGINARFICDFLFRRYVGNCFG